MDVIGGLLNGPRASGAFLLRMVMDPPWAIHVEDEAPLTLVAAVRGEAWITPDAPDEPAVRLRPGDVAIVIGPGHYAVGDDPATRIQAVVGADQRCSAPDGSDLPMARSLGVRTWGTNPDGATMLLVGTYALPGEISQRVLRALPPLVVVPADASGGSLILILREEIGRDEPGQEAVLDRLLDLCLVATLRAWFARSGPDAPGWFRAQADPVVGQALRLLHHDPAHPWTVASLAAEIGISRAALARRFSALVGQPPMTYLAEWRLTVAADLLHEPGATVGSVAAAVGYGTPFALSAAFKRVRGISPAEHRGGRARRSPRPPDDDERPGRRRHRPAPTTRSSPDGVAVVGSGTACQNPSRGAIPMTPIRAAIRSDAAALHALAAETFPLACPPGASEESIAAFVAEVLSAERFEQYIADPQRDVLIAGAFDGYALVVHGEPTDGDVAAALTTRPTAELSKIYVRPGRQGSGVARALLEATIQAARARGARAVWLGVNQQNARANAFYEKSGFAQVGIKHFVVGGEVHDDFTRELVLTDG